MVDAPRLILASGSQARKAMLTSAGVHFDIIPADIDEKAMTRSLLESGQSTPAENVATVLAAEKAAHVSRQHPNAIVIGSDQILVLDKKLYAKANTIAHARQTLVELRGKTHTLVSAVALARGSQILWQSADTAELTVRDFSDEFLESYLAEVGDRILGSVGCYEIEGAGIQLFHNVNGNHFTILGMPLLPLLNELRQRNVVRT